MFRLKGKTTPIRVHELWCRMEDANGKQREACATFADGLAAFQKGAWDVAMKVFQKVITERGEDGPSRFYLDLCGSYRKSPPAQPWDGVVHMEKK